MEHEISQIVAADIDSGGGTGDSGATQGSKGQAVDLPEIVVSEEHFNIRELNRPEAELHVVYRPDHTPTSEIVFVHGLNGDAESTWIGLGDESVFWPRDLLAKDMRHSRIWIYSYNSQIDMTSNTKAPLADVFRRMGSELKISLENQTHGPLILVAHSLGGLIVKTALALSGADDVEVSENSIASRTRGVIFMGTPHAGSTPGARAGRFATILSVFSRHQTLVRHESFAGELRLDGTITRTTSDFAALMDRKGFPIVSLFESQPMLTDWGPRLVVDEFTKLKHPNETVDTLEGNHLTMCKFEAREERGYALILKALSSFQKSISFERLKLVSSPLAPTPTTPKATSISDADLIDIGTLFSRLRLKFDVPFTRWTSLKVHSYDDGLWFPNSEYFKRWISGSKDMPLLIHGPVGCGKTMIVESILEDLRHRSVDDGFSLSICHLHLSFRSDQVAYQSPLAILAALMTQTLDSNSSLARHFKKVPHRFENLNAMSQALLKGTLRQMLEDSCWKEIYLVIDALDECHESFVRSSYDIITWVLEIPKLHAIFTNSPCSSIDESDSPTEYSPRSLDLASELGMWLQERKLRFDALDLRGYDPWD